MNISAFESLLREKRTLTMGVLNVTPDSFSDGGEFIRKDSALERAALMLAEGADIIDIGGQSTRPPGSAYGFGARQVNLDEELNRVIPVIESLIREYPETIISIDTTKSEVAAKAIEAGATIINDVSGATEDSMMLDIAKEKNAPIILMHGYGPEFSKEKIEDYHYKDVVNEVYDWLKERIKAANSKGIKNILADIGFGFAKKADDNITLLRNHQKFTELGVQMVLGVSRKSTIGKILGGVAPLERINGSIAAAVYGAMNGAKIIRPHDVKQTVEALKVVDKISNTDSQSVRAD
jgi:dihydropteroate synthase